MSLRSRRFLRLLLPMIAVMCLSAAPQQQLNPTVNVLPAATSTVPPECEEGLAPQPRPRITAEEKTVARQITTPPELQAPPTNDLRRTLRDGQTAAERNDRASFADSLARVKTILAGYPSGSERTGAEKAVAVYDDISTLWEYQLTPAGSFFDASSNLFKMLSAYPGYDTFIRRQILVDQTGARFYPSSESRAFLTQIAAGRLKDIGIKSAAASTPAATQTAAAAPVTHEKKTVVHETAPKSAQTAATGTAPHKRHGTGATTNTHRAAKSTVSKSKPVQVAEAKPATTKKPAEATTVKKTTTAETTAAAPMKKTTVPEAKIDPSTTAATHVEKPIPATATTPTTQPATHTVSETPVPPPPTTTTTSAPTGTIVASSDTAASATTGSETTSTPTATETTASAATADTASTDTTGSAEKQQSGSPGEPRNLLWPIILIVVGVGVLILLFRTSPGGK